MEAVLLAGGKGTRLYPMSATTPKSLLPVAGIAVIDRLIAQLRAAHVHKITVAVGHMADRVRTHLGSGRAHGVQIRYLEEASPLDTAGCLGQLASISDPFLLVNADIVTEFPFPQLVKTHRHSGALATVATRAHCVSLEFGVLQTDDDGSMQSYVEKPRLDYWIAIGVYCFAARVCSFVEPGAPLSMPQLLRRLHAAGELVRGYRTAAAWFDIGTPEGYRSAEQFCQSSDRQTLRLAA